MKSSLRFNTSAARKKLDFRKERKKIPLIYPLWLAEEASLQIISYDQQKM